jgi:hypothetical protein
MRLGVLFGKKRMSLNAKKNPIKLARGNAKKIKI